MNWLWIAVGTVGFRLVELGLFAVDVMLCAVGHRSRKSSEMPSQNIPQKTGEASIPDSSEVAGQIATVIAPLNPRGWVELNGVEFPALSFRGKPARGAQVRVVRSGRYSLLVEPLT